MRTPYKVTTDLADYAPGATAFISATGFAEGSAVTFLIQHVSGPGPDGVYGTLDDDIKILGGDGHDPWVVIDGGDDDLDGLVNGEIATSWYVNPDDSAYERFLLTAQADGEQIASTSFTDSPGSTNKVYQHWADGDAQSVASAEWNNNILNDNKSDYFEGEVIPHVFVYKASNNAPLVNGQTYSFNVTYNFYQQSTDALGFDFLTTFDASRVPGPLNVTNPYVTPSLDSTFMNNGGFTSFGEVNQGFYTVDADITNVSQITATGSGNIDHKLTVTFVYTGETTSNGVAEIYYGLHIASLTDLDKGASAWSGGSLQTTVDIGGSGATSLQLAPSAIIAGSISGYKFEDLNGNAIWDGGEQALSGWTIFLDENGNDLLDSGEMFDTTDANGMYSFSVTPDADKSTPLTNDAYVVREVNQASWLQTTSNPEGITISAITPTATNVNFGNQQQTYSITLKKITGDGAGGIGDGDGVTLTAGAAVVWTYEVTNTGNVALSTPTVVDDNGTVDVSDDFGPSAVVVDGVIQGDADKDGRFDAGETWVYQATGVAVTGWYSNKATASSAYGMTEVSATDDSNYFGAKSEISLKKITGDGAGGIGDGDGVTLTAGAAVVWTYEVTNTGNVALSTPTVVDDNGTVDVSDDFGPSAVVVDGVIQGDADKDGRFDAGETWVYQATGTVKSGDYSNIATVTATDGKGGVVTAKDGSSYFGKVPSQALIAPTTTTPQEYISGTARSFEDFYAAQGGVIQYTVKSGKLNSTNPGVFFYFTGANGSIIGTDGSDADSLADAMTVVIDQTRTSSNAQLTTPFQTAKNGIQLYKVISADSVIDASDSLVTVRPTSITTNSDGDISIRFTPDAVNAMYVVSVKYATTTSFVGSTITNPASWPTVNYNFDTKIGGTIIETYAGGIDLAPKAATFLTLEGVEGAGAGAIRASQAKAAYAAALDWWEGRAFDTSELKHKKISVADLGDADGNWTLAMTQDGQITIDDDAANHGWSLGVGKVAPGKVDLLSVLVHEVGHLLGLTHDQMGSTLDVGVRSLPMIDDIDDPMLPASPVGLVGVMSAEPPALIGG